MTDMTPPGQAPGAAAGQPTGQPGSQPPLAQPVQPAAPAGWYADSSPGVLRYWNGVAWTDHRAPMQQVGVPPQASWPNTTLPGAVTYGAAVGGFTADGTFVIADRRVCTPWERFGAYLLDALLMLVTLYIGWLIWACFTAPNGQTPGKKLVGQRVYRLSDGKPAEFGTMLGMRGLVGGLVFGLSFYVLVGFVLVFMPFWDNKNQTVIDKISSTVVVHDPV